MSSWPSLKPVNVLLRVQDVKGGSKRIYFKTPEGKSFSICEDERNLASCQYGCPRFAFQDISCLADMSCASMRFSTLDHRTNLTLPAHCHLRLRRTLSQTLPAAADHQVQLQFSSLILSRCSAAHVSLNDSLSFPHVCTGRRANFSR